MLNQTSNSLHFLGQSAGAIASAQGGAPATEIGAIQSQIMILEERLREVVGNQDIIEQRLIPISLPYPVSNPCPKSGQTDTKCQIESAIFAANEILYGLAERQRLTMQHLQV